jgi:hypothetical protein
MFGRPELGVRRSRFEPLSNVLAPLAFESSLVSYKGIQGTFEQLWISEAGSAEESAMH